MNGTAAICRSEAQCDFVLISAAELTGRGTTAFCLPGHKMVYKGSTSTTNGMNKMIYLVCASRIFDMLGYI